jgi:hypothetical protein
MPQELAAISATLEARPGGYIRWWRQVALLPYEKVKVGAFKEKIIGMLFPGPREFRLENLTCDEEIGWLVDCNLEPRELFRHILTEPLVGNRHARYQAVHDRSILELFRRQE